MKGFVFGVLVALAVPAAADGDEHTAMSGSVKAFHDVLSPNWHQPAGAGRSELACENAAKYRELADAVVAERREGEAVVQAAGGLRGAAQGLDVACKSANEPGVDAALTALHDRFHDLMAALRPRGGKAH